MNATSFQSTTPYALRMGFIALPNLPTIPFDANVHTALTTVLETRIKLIARRKITCASPLPAILHTLFVPLRFMDDAVDEFA
jgi:hypothetical protein